MGCNSGMGGAARQKKGIVAEATGVTGHHSKTSIRLLNKRVSEGVRAAAGTSSDLRTRGHSRPQSGAMPLAICAALDPTSSRMRGHTKVLFLTAPASIIYSGTR